MKLKTAQLINVKSNFQKKMKHYNFFFHFKYILKFILIDLDED